MQKNARAFVIFLLLCSPAYGEDLTVQSLSDGACWLEENENTDSLKIASFNDKETLLINKEDMSIKVSELLVKGLSSPLVLSERSLHCGAYGSSIVMKLDYQGRAACLWLKIKKGQLEVRSLGGLEPTKSQLCDGYKWGELIIGLKSSLQKNELISHFMHNTFSNVAVVSTNLIKVTLREEFFGKELEVIESIKKEIDVKYIELNTIQHPVGLATPLR
ncbi:MAG: hypothetical protein HOP07_01790 [Bacteriovoracaceae bacterium]|nr:hypothetical protein [Bacteriovoracaceae bacterium]